MPEELVITDVYGNRVRVRTHEVIMAIGKAMRLGSSHTVSLNDCTQVTVDRSKEPNTDHECG